ncbi:hypothetical protein PF008_g27705 [Phytophthora fragariae]|uniref:Uncharacterized protein n=1 Tax=Phytophthora fragariae TaxID=53985 RepID=A0A6G0QDD5_9STRA|nr:hypothetical protein PF008_g27705 [Phytophthora fragariae]
MAHGSTALHGCVADKLEAAMDNMVLHTETHALQQRQAGRHHSKQGQVHGREDKTYGVYKPGPSRCC